MKKAHILVALLVAGGAAMTIMKPAEKPKTAEQTRMEQLRGRAVEAASQLRANMKDPDSFQVSSAILLPDGSACYEYRSKNSFAAVAPGIAVLTAGGQMIAGDQSSPNIAAAWNATCSGKSGDDIGPLIRMRM